MARPRKKPSPKSRRKKGARATARGPWRLLFKIGVVGLVLGLIALVVLDAMVRSKFEGKRWSVPARVYARPLELYAGLPVSADVVIRELKALGYTRKSNAPAAGQYDYYRDRLLIHSRGFRFWDGREDSRALAVDFDAGGIRQLDSRSGPSVALARLEPLLIGGIYPGHNEDRILIKRDQAPDQLVQALLVTEDRNFYQHHGVALRSIARALVANLRAGGVVQGGSTLTQQLVKNFYLTSKRSLTRKGMEAVMAVLLDAHYEKDDILEAYLNEIYLGQSGRRAIHGIGLAAQFYFGKPVAGLDLHESALLVGLIKGPSYYDPRRSPERAKKRRDLVLQLMEEAGVITAAAARDATARPLGVVSRPSWSDSMFPGFLDLVRRQLSRDYREEDLTSEGLRIFTTLDPQVQWQAEASLSGSLDQLEKQHGIKAGSLEGAIVVTSTEGGEALAVVGGRRTRYSGFNRALDARRAIGSLVKPAVYLTALNDPKRYTLSTLVRDEEIRLQQPNGELWEPLNFDRKVHGRVPIYEALSRSYNLATANLGLDLGVGRVLETLQELGVDALIKPYPSMLLGTAELTPLEVAGMYQTLAAGGFRSPVRAIREVLAADGSPLSRYPLEVRQTVGAGPAHLIQYGMQITMAEGTGAGAYRVLSRDIQAAGKTGTTNDLRDSWFAGYTGNYLAVVWMGRDDNRPTPLTGSGGALRAWADLMNGLHAAPLVAAVPPGVEYHWVDEASGRLSARNCEGARLIPYIEGSAPQESVACAGVLAPVKRWFDSWFE